MVTGRGLLIETKFRAGCGSCGSLGLIRKGPGWLCDETPSRGALRLNCVGAVPLLWRFVRLPHRVRGTKTFSRSPGAPGPCGMIVNAPPPTHAAQANETRHPPHDHHTVIHDGV